MFLRTAWKASHLEVSTASTNTSTQENTELGGGDGLFIQQEDHLLQMMDFGNLNIHLQDDLSTCLTEYNLDVLGLSFGE
jgi:hypothetical protein